MDNTVGTLARVNGSSHPGTGHTVYNVTFKILRPQIAPFWNKAPVAFTFTRRFSEFHTLFTDLINNYKQHVPNWPEFPQRHYFGRFKPETIYQRISAFSALLNFISLHPVMFNSPPVLKFLGMESPLVEEDTVVSTEGVQRVTLTTFPEVGRGVVINKRSFSNPLH
ncbi:hypothetical protein BCR33DRAFT_714404 [Rhizoclosmatium globosum]|uniref:PX domain-containing protein n=1 Tax=Rhizoclosmatium globosum TaxID=329046 RepID=A0A1Y2CQP7_9FUNG|nr:hypothetical protein BCR33DRAFT_714404 [Rhizoclosmatium globosum]|eukprot:ORY48675.1 hypothetical protein BCR33DRAFT_714404 [Rhizoclosmatium globosum]